MDLKLLVKVYVARVVNTLLGYVSISCCHLSRTIISLEGGRERYQSNPGM